MTFNTAAVSAVHDLQQCCCECCACPSTLLLSVLNLCLTMPMQIDIFRQCMLCLNSLSGSEDEAVRTLQQGFDFRS